MAKVEIPYKYKEGMLVEYKGSKYWIYEVKANRLTLVPQEAMDWEEGILKLNNAFQIDSGAVTLLD